MLYKATVVRRYYKAVTIGILANDEDEALARFNTGHFQAQLDEEFEDAKLILEDEEEPEWEGTIE